MKQHLSLYNSAKKLFFIVSLEGNIRKDADNAAKYLNTFFYTFRIFDKKRIEIEKINFYVP